MANKRIIAGIGVLCLIAGAIGIFLIERPVKIESSNDKPEEKQIVPVAKPVKIPQKASIKGDLYSDTPYYMPLLSVVEISELKPEVKKKVDEILENSQGFYFLKHDKKTGETVILLQNPVKDNSNYIRHNLQTAIVADDGSVTYKNIGYSGEEGEIDNSVEQKTDSWEFDTSVEPYRPLKHTAYDNHKKVLYTEVWNYGETESIRYEMKDAKDKTISIIKETTDGNDNYRKEHIFYDSNGNTEKSLSANYEGADIKWFTYYDAKNPENNISIESVYNDGLKTEEKIYNQEYKLMNTLKADYSDGERTELTLFDGEGKEKESIKSDR